VPYTGTIPVLGNNQLCERILVDIQTTQGSTVACTYPSGSGACAATPVSTDLLSSLTSSSMAPATSSAGAVTVLIRMVLASASAAGVLGLHLLPDLGFTTKVGNWSAEVTYPSTTTLEM
jgi:hypothetical protein